MAKINDVAIKNGKLPGTPGVYLMKAADGSILYVGKAVSLKRRVESYFSRPHDSRIQKLVSEIREIDYEETDSAIEALIREADLIKKLRPPYNVREKDDKSFLCVVVTKEKFPRVLLARFKDVTSNSRYFGPFTSAASIKAALRILRKIFPWSEHEKPDPRGKCCFNYQIGLCPGVCCGAITLNEYRKNIRHLVMFFGGKKQRILTALEKDMKMASKTLNFEKAEKIRRQIFALQHIQDVAFVHEDEIAEPKDRPKTRIEGYDISNISGDSAVGSMVVFENDKPNKNEYRKFRIRTIEGSNDVGMLAEVLRRRFTHPEWRTPDLLLIDGGVPQVNTAKSTLRELQLKIPVVGIAKGPERKRNDLIGLIPPGIATKATLIRVRDEAHRFAISYHKRLRGRKFLAEAEEG